MDEITKLEKKIELLEESNKRMWEAFIKISKVDNESYEEDVQEINRIVSDILEVDWMFVD